LMASGKRLRPMLLTEFAKLFNQPCAYIADFAASLEMIHTYSLIHDDLPAMDNDDLRRGKPTNHVVFGEATAILAGDALLNYAYENIMDCAMKDPLNALKYLEAGKIIAEASGHKGMILGQIADLMNEGNEIDIETLDFINQHKTGDLLRAAMMAGRNANSVLVQIVYRCIACREISGRELHVGDDLLELGRSFLAHRRVQRVLELGESRIERRVGVALAIVGTAGAPEHGVDRIGRSDPAAIDQVVAALVARLAIGNARLVVGNRFDADGLELGDHHLLDQFVGADGTDVSRAAGNEYEHG